MSSARDITGFSSWEDATGAAGLAGFLLLSFLGDFPRVGLLFLGGLLTGVGEEARVTRTGDLPDDRRASALRCDSRVGDRSIASAGDRANLDLRANGSLSCILWQTCNQMLKCRNNGNFAQAEYRLFEWAFATYNCIAFFLLLKSALLFITVKYIFKK